MAKNEKVIPAKQWVMQSLPDMDDDQFQQWQTLLEDRTGMLLAPQRKTYLQTSLGIRMREIGCTDYQEYYNKVVSGPRGVIEWATLVDRLTVQETRFFRNRSSCNLVKDYLITRPDEVVGRAIEIWSVGCSTGEEAYTLAMIAEECLGALGIGTYYGITGTDISQPALVKAREGSYHRRKLEALEPRLRTKFFEPLGNERFRIIDTLRERVCFARVNVLELDSTPMHGMDVIYCQNLLIYFRRWRRKEILNRLVERLVPGGLLVLGLGEIVDWVHPHLERVPDDKTLAYTRIK